MTVSHVINNHPHVRPETRDRVLQAVAELGYRPNVAARRLRSGRSDAITLALPQLSFGYYQELVGAIIDQADRRGLAVLVEPTGGIRDRELALLDGDRLRLTDGLLFAPFGLEPTDVAGLGWPTPTVLVGGDRVPNAPVARVSVDNIAAAEDATAYLLASGCRQIAAIGTRSEAAPGVASQRLRGYRRALAAAGIRYDKALVVEAARWQRADGAAAMARLLKRGVCFDAIFAFNDLLAFGALRALQEAGLRVPQDVAVMGVDDLDECRFAAPSLSSVNLGLDEVAAEAVRLLCQGMETPGMTLEPELHLARYQLVRRESTSPIGSPQTP